MRVVGLVGIVLALVVVGWLAKSQLRPPAAASFVGDGPPSGSDQPGGAAASPQQVQQQYRQALEDALKQARPAQDP